VIRAAAEVDVAAEGARLPLFLGGQDPVAKREALDVSITLQQVPRSSLSAVLGEANRGRTTLATGAVALAGAAACAVSVLLV